MSRRLLYKPVDEVGRSRIYYTNTVGIDDFVEKCRFLEEDIRKHDGTRWTARALVSDPGPIVDLHARIEVEAPLEVIRMPVQLDGKELTYLWVSRNLPERQPGEQAQASFLESVGIHLDKQNFSASEFEHRSRAMLDAAVSAGLRVVCNDPFGGWGVDRLPRDTFQRMMDQAFYIDPGTANKLLDGHGYSPLWHYMFGLVDRHGELLCIVMMAKWPWGFEATYAILNREYVATTGALTAGIMKVLLFLASCLLIGRHGSAHLVYGEADIANCGPCMDAGFEIVPPNIGLEHRLVHQNVVWADNPIGTLHKPPFTPPPHFSERPYTSYVLMRLNAAKLTSFVDQALDFLEVRAG